MTREVHPGQVHALADLTAEAAQELVGQAGELSGLPVGDDGFETGAVLHRVAEDLARRWADQADDTSRLADAIHDSAAAVERTEASNTELAQGFLRGLGGGA